MQVDKFLAEKHSPVYSPENSVRSGNNINAKTTYPANTKEYVGNPNQTSQPKKVAATKQYSDQYRNVGGIVRKKSLVREAILKFSENSDTTQLPTPPEAKCENIGAFKKPLNQTSDVTKPSVSKQLPTKCRTQETKPEPQKPNHGTEEKQVKGGVKTHEYLGEYPKEGLSQERGDKVVKKGDKPQNPSIKCRTPETKPEPPKPNQGTNDMLVRGGVNTQEDLRGPQEEELNQEMGNKDVKEGGKPQEQLNQNQTTINQTRVGKPNQMGKKKHKEGGQPTITEILAKKDGNQTLRTQNQTIARNTGTKPKTRKPKEPNQSNTKSTRKNQTTRKPNNEGGKQQTIISLLKPKPSEETCVVNQENQPTMKPPQKPNQNTEHQPTARPHTKPDVTEENLVNDCDKTKPRIETRKPDSETKPNLTKKKPPKLNTKVVHPNDLQQFLATKKKERELKLFYLRENEKIIPKNTPSTPSDRCSATLHPIQPPPLLHSASGPTQTYTALHRTIDSGKQESNANPGATNLSGNLLLAEKSKNLG